MEERMFKIWAPRACCQYLAPDGASQSWLVLTPQGLGCKLCLGTTKEVSARRNKGFADGSYQVKMGASGAVYLYERTFKEHTSSILHKKALSDLAAPTQDSATPAPATPTRLAGVQSSRALSPAAGAAEPGSADRSCSGSPTPKSLAAKFKNHLFAVCLEPNKIRVLVLFAPPPNMGGTGACSMAWRRSFAARSLAWPG